MRTTLKLRPAAQRTKTEALILAKGWESNGHFEDVGKSGWDLWEKQRNGRNGSLVAKLQGARLVLSSERTAARLDEAFVKLFTAADLLTSHQKYKPA